MYRIKSLRVAAVAALAAMMLVSTVTPAFATTTLKASGSTTLQPLAVDWAAAYHKLHSGTSVTVVGGGSGVGFTDAEAGRVDLGMSSRTKTSSDPSDLVMTAVARDAVAVIINPKNKLSSMSPDTVRKIFIGQITNWHQVSSSFPNKTIVLCGRTGASGTYAYFKSVLLNGSNQSSKTKTYTSNGMVRSAVAGNQYAIGYVSMSYINSKVKGVKMKGIAPTQANALSGKYPYVRDLFFITKGAPKGEALNFINYCKGTAGQKIAKADYYLPLH
jgi:phosphate transport system substrate-binding protein